MSSPTPSAASANRGLLPYLTRHWQILSLGVFLSLVAAVAGLCFPPLAGKLIDAAMNGGEANVTPTLRLDLEAIAATVAVAILVIVVFVYAAERAFTVITQRVVGDMRRDIYSHIVRLPMAFFMERKVGDVSTRIWADVGVIENAIGDVAPKLCQQMVFLVGGLVLLAFTSLKLTFVMLLIVPAVSAALYYVGRKARQVARSNQDAIADLSTVMHDTLAGISCVKAFVSELVEVRRFERSYVKIFQIGLRGGRWQSIARALSLAAFFVGTFAVMYTGAKLLISSQITPGELTRFVLLTGYVASGIAQVSECFSRVQKAYGATERVREILAERTEDAVTLESEGARNFQPPLRLLGKIEFAEIAFSYPSRPDVPVLRQISLQVGAGEMVALVGPSGAGKSTLISLVLRLFDPGAGHIFLDGHDVRKYPLRWLRQQVAYVPQDILLLGGTIADAIGYGRQGATFAEIKRAAQDANIDEFVMSLPRGYDTEVGERGVQLSGGQRQRIAIARALLKDPAILLLDEPTSSLDSENEGLVQSALGRLMRGRTTLIIAHRLSTVQRANRIVVLDGGRIIETGTHDDLIVDRYSRYRRMWDLQSRGIGRATSGLETVALATPPNGHKTNGHAVHDS